jgi:alpha/beta superfamily hydrolase
MIMNPRGRSYVTKRSSGQKAGALAHVIHPHAIIHAALNNKLALNLNKTKMHAHILN